MAFFITNIKRKNTLLNIVDFLKDFLKVKKKKKKTNQQNMRRVFEKLENKTRNSTGPLAKSWKILEYSKQTEIKLKLVKVQC